MLDSLDFVEFVFFAYHPDPVVLVDLQGKCIRINAAFEQSFNVSVAVVVGNDLTAIVKWNQWDDVWLTQDYPSQYILWRENSGKKIIEKVSVIPVVSDRQSMAAYLIVQDITETQLLEERYREKKEILDLIESNSSDIIAVVDDQGSIRYISPSYSTIFGRPHSEVIHRYALEYVHPEDVPFLEQRLKESLNGFVYWPPVEFRYLHMNGEWKYLDARATPVETKNGMGQITLFLRDITQRKEQEELIQHIAYYDALTDLPNRHYLRKRLEQMLNSEPKQLALLFIDLDGFKQVNDTQGHTAGDVLLQQVSERLSRHLPKDGFLARMGGDEFIILLDDQTDCRQFAQMVLRLFETPFVVHGQPNLLTTSIGISVYPKSGRTAEELIRTADIALYQAKNNGKNSFSTFSTGV